MNSRSSSWCSDSSQYSPSPSPDLECVPEEPNRSYQDCSSSTNDLPYYGRRNPWGHQSYADLITQAINSSQEKRLTLNQIYEWLMLNIPFFAERKDSSMSAGWKNSIRHNLSLHQKFKKVPNEGTGKSSWWVLNPDMSSVKKTRRRAHTGDSKMLESKRDKVKSKIGTRRYNLKSNLLILHHKFNSLFRYSICNGLPNIKEENHDPHEQFQFQRPRSHSVNSSVSSQNSYTSFDHITKDDLNFIDFFGKNSYQVQSSNDLCYNFTSNLKFVEENLLL